MLLTAGQGSYLSGADISKTLGVTRMAVSNAVRALRESGYEISAVTNRGYCLQTAPDRLTSGDVLGLLTPDRRSTVRVFASVDSTNTYLKREAMNGAPHGLCAIANEQTAGRGRVGRSFLSRPDCGVYLSMLLRPKCPPEVCASLTAHTAVAVCLAIERVCGVEPGIKWTNDIVLAGQKICGILTELTLESESSAVDSVVIGIGANSLVGDILAGIFLLMEGNIQVGDVVKIGDFRGYIQEMGIRMTKLFDMETYDVKIIPNKEVQNVVHMTMHTAIVYSTFMISYEEDLERVEKLLKEELSTTATAWS